MRFYNFLISKEFMIELDCSLIEYRVKPTKGTFKVSIINMSMNVFGLRVLAHACIIRLQFVDYDSHLD
jgi:hypothetical protein